MRVLKLVTQEGEKAFQELMDRRAHVLDEMTTSVEAAIKKYREEREQALLSWAREFDHIELSEGDLWIEDDYIKTSHKLVSSETRKAIDHAKERVERFQEQLKLASFQSTDEAGVFWGTEIRPLDRVGIYVPGGRANYFMSLLLCAVPARIAGVEDLLVATPPKKKLGRPYVDPTLLYLAKVLSIPRILLAGSVGAMAAMAFGTKKSLPVEKVVGSGGRRTAVAKIRLSGFVGVDGLSGPSETAFICDKTSHISSVAADIIGKADHDPDAEIYVFHSSAKWIEELVQSLVQKVERLKHQSTVRACLENRTNFFVVKNFAEAIDRVNQLAPGVVCLAVDEASSYVAEVKACGSLLLGHFTPPVGLDLVGGPSGLVSTLGAATYSISMSPASFVRRFPVMEFDRAALQRFETDSIKLSKEEGFLTHEDSFKARSSP